MRVTEFTFDEDGYDRAQQILIQMHEERDSPKLKPSYVIATLGEDEAVEFQRRLKATGIGVEITREGEIADSQLQEA